jgi:hypothetical protein
MTSRHTDHRDHYSDRDHRDASSREIRRTRQLVNGQPPACSEWPRQQSGGTLRHLAHTAILPTRNRPQTGTFQARVRRITQAHGSSLTPTQHARRSASRATRSARLNASRRGACARRDSGWGGGTVNLYASAPRNHLRPVLTLSQIRAGGDVVVGRP